MSISKKERKYRLKFIAEHHYNKEEQRIFDKAVAEIGMRYKEVYLTYRAGVVHAFMSTIALSRMTKALYSVGICTAEAANIFNRIAEAWNQALPKMSSDDIEEVN